MKKFMILFLSIMLCFTTACSAPSPIVDRLYNASDAITMSFLDEHLDFEVDTTFPYTVLSLMEGFSIMKLEALTFDEIVFIEYDGSEEVVEFTFPYAFQKNDIVINIFTYENEYGDQTIVEIGNVTEDGSERVNVSELPTNQLIVMYVLHGVAAELFNN